MKRIGEYQNTMVYFSDYIDLVNNELPIGNWICLLISNSEPHFEKFDKFIRFAIDDDLLEFRSHGLYGELLYEWFGDIVNFMEFMEDHHPIEINASWDASKSLDNMFWHCLHSTGLPGRADLNNLKVVCIDLDGKNRLEELADCLEQFKKGWIPTV